MTSWLQDNNIEMYSIHNKGKSVVAEIFIKTLKAKIHKYMTSISKNVYIDKLDDILSRIKMNPAKVKNKRYIDLT